MTTHHQPIFTETLRNTVKAAFEKRYNASIDISQITINETPPEFTGDFTVVTFALAKTSRQNPQAVAEALGNDLVEALDGIASYNVVKGFLNIVMKDSWWMNRMQAHAQDQNFGRLKRLGEKVMVEYCGPNTNKPLHLGHIRNILIGYSVAEILNAAGYDVIKVNIYNDRGVHICKSMLAYNKFGHGETPVTSDIKGDHLVGDYYVKFETALKEEVQQLVQQGISEDDARKQAPLSLEVQKMLIDWENNVPEVRALWTTMNSWVYEGFEKTFERIGCDFHKHYHESQTYLLGKEIVEEGLAKGVFFKKDDGSVWIDLTADGLDQKLLLRADGTSVYITQDLGTADLRYKDFGATRMIYTVANEQDYHFKVLKLVCEKLGKPYAGGIYHLSYGMVDLPTGRMKSREGTVVDADDLLDEMEATAEQRTKELGKIDDFKDDEKKKLYHTIGLGALKFFILRVDPRKRMTFDPNESIDFQGFTGPFIQYTHARIRSVLRKASEQNIDYAPPSRYEKLQPAERNLLRILCAFPEHVYESAKAYDPANLANYLFKIAKAYNHFYTEHSILNADTSDEKIFRLQLSVFTTQVIRNGMKLLGIDVPEKM
jgi:arginyl-tRNA synthetase